MNTQDKLKFDYSNEGRELIDELIKRANGVEDEVEETDKDEVRTSKWNWCE